MGAGWAGSYMPGLKALSDVAEGPQQSRAVAAHAAAVGVSGALSFGVAGAGRTRGSAGTGRWCRARSAPCSRSCWCWSACRPGAAARRRPRGALLDFRPILRNRSALAYSLAYCVHTWEMSALRGMGRRVPHVLRGAGRRRAGRRSRPPRWRARWGCSACGRACGATSCRSGSDGGASSSARCSRPRRWPAVIGFAPALPYAGAAALVLRVRDADLVGLVVADSWQRRQRRARPARRDAGRPLDARVRGRLPRSAGARRDARSVRRRQRDRVGLRVRARDARAAPGVAAFVWLRPADLAGDRPAAAALEPAPPPARLAGCDRTMRRGAHASKSSGPAGRKTRSSASHSAFAHGWKAMGASTMITAPP